MMKAIRKFSLASKLLLVFLMVIIPVVTSVFLYSTNMLTQLRSNVIQSATQNHHNIALQLDYEMDTMKQQLYYLSNQNEWNYLLHPTNDGLSYDMVAAINRLKAQFTIVLNTSRIFADVYAYIPSISRVLSANHGLFPLVHTEKELSRFQKQIQENRFHRLYSIEGKLFISTPSGYAYNMA